MNRPQVNSFRPVLLIPHYEHLRQLCDSLPQLRAAGIPMLVVDDGSSRETAGKLAQAAVAHDFELLSLPLNQGKGSAVMAGFAHAALQGYTHALQMDADGQHNPLDIARFLDSAASRPDTMVCGTPVFGADAPRVRVWGRKLTDGVVFLETWTRGIRDSLCGFRVYPLDDTLRVIQRHRPGARMDFDAELLVNACWDGMPLHFLATRVIYPEAGVSHFHYLRDNLRMIRMHLRLLARMAWRSPVLVQQRLQGKGPRVTGD